MTDETPSANVPATQGSAGALIPVDFGTDAGGGLENMGTDERRVPFMNILQSNSPQVKRVSEGGIAGALAGMFLISSTGEVLDGEKGFWFIPAKRDHYFIEFTPRNLGGGLIAILPPDDKRVLALRAKQGKFGKLTTATKWDAQHNPLDGTEITEIFGLAGYACSVGALDEVFPAFVGFKSTQIKKYQTMMDRVAKFFYETKAGKVNPPLWAHCWLVRTVGEKNKKGEFYGFKITLSALNPDGSEKDKRESLLFPNHPVYIAAKKLHDDLVSGAATVDREAAGADDDGVAQDDGGEIPF